MYVAEIVRKRSGAPVLSRKEIDIIGENLVSDFNPDAMQTPQEIDIDLFVQDYLGADQDLSLIHISTVASVYNISVPVAQMQGDETDD